MLEAITPTSFEQLEQDIAALQAAKGRFASLAIADRLRLLEFAAEGVAEVQEEWVAAGCSAKGLDVNSALAGEEWLGGPCVTQRNIRLLQVALADIRDHGRPILPEDSVSTRSSGQTVAQVFPTSTFDKMMFTGFTAEIWMESDVTPANILDTMALPYQAGASRDGAVSLVLGAGNVSSIGPMDVLYKMFVENEVVILKMNPVNEYLGPFFERAFKSFIEADFLRMAYGGAEVGAFLCKHAGVDNIHITGSDKTHDVIVWGPPGEEQAKRKAEDNPINSKPISSELGNVSPVIVVPGPWKKGEIAFHAVNIASQVCNNGSFNCNAAKLIIQWRDWEHRETLMDQVAETLTNAPRRDAYYPGAMSRYDSFLSAHPEGVATGERTSESIPWTIIRDVDSSKSDDISFTTEAFCGVLSETALDAEDPADFIRVAAEFCNDTVWGTLNACILIHPESLKDPEVAQAFDDALDVLHYGTIGVNHWPALGYGLVTPTWGAYPGHSLKDIQSGRGSVHNTYMFSKPQKSVVRGPFTMFPKPAWFVTNKSTHQVARRMADFERAPSVFKLPGIIIKALGG
jgi:hypothetical protein